jgi:hypothetical protein
MATHLRADGHARRAHADRAGSATVAATSGRLVGESLDELMAELARSDGRLPAATIARLARLVGAVGSLRDLHPVDGAGRCLSCRPGAGWPRRRRPCGVYQVLDEFLGSETAPPVSRTLVARG